MSDPVEIIVRVYHDQKPNGDRDTQKHECKRYEVVFRREANGKEVLLARFDQFDSFHCAIRPLGPVQEDAETYAIAIADALQCPVRKKHYWPKVTTIWEERPAGGQMKENPNG